MTKTENSEVKAAIRELKRILQEAIMVLKGESFKKKEAVA